MKVTLSPLKFRSFYITDIRYEFNLDGENDDLQIDELPYEIDIDFLPIDTTADIFPVYVKLQVNNGKSKLPGHSLFVTAGGLFELDSSLDLPEVTFKNLRNLSPLTMLISSLRGFIKQLSSHTPQGGYLLPSVNIYELVAKRGKKRKKQVKEGIQEISKK